MRSTRYLFVVCLTIAGCGANVQSEQSRQSLAVPGSITVGGEDGWTCTGTVAECARQALERPLPASAATDDDDDDTMPADGKAEPWCFGAVRVRCSNGRTCCGDPESCAEFCKLVEGKCKVPDVGGCSTGGSSSGGTGQKYPKE